MKKLFITAIILCCTGLPLVADSAAVMEADKLYDQGLHKESIDIIKRSLSAASDKTETFELQWRLARATMEVGDIREKEGLDKEGLIDIFQEAVGYAEDAISTDPGNPRGYFWKSANLGRWGEVKGIMESLNMAKEMRDLLQKSITLDPEFGLGWHVLGILYERVPGGISFGNNDFAVSLARKAVDIHEKAVKTGIDDEISYGYYIELARHLNKRNFNAARRSRNQGKIKNKHKAASDLFEKNCYYEAAVTLKKQSDREEARALIKWTVDKLKAIRNPTFSQTSDLEDALETLKELK